MFVTLVMNIIHVILDYIFIFGPFGLPILGVKGVAISTTVSKILGLIVMLYILFIKVERNLKFRHLNSSKKVVIDLLRIGIPTAGEQLSYNISQLSF